MPAAMPEAHAEGFPPKELKMLTRAAQSAELSVPLATPDELQPAFASCAMALRIRSARTRGRATASRWVAADERSDDGGGRARFPTPGQRRN